MNIKFNLIKRSTVIILLGIGILFLSFNSNSSFPEKKTGSNFFAEIVQLNSLTVRPSYVNFSDSQNSIGEKINSELPEEKEEKEVKAAVAEVQEPDSGIVVWGDSMGGDLKEERFTEGFKALGYKSSGRNFVNGAIGGQSSWQVAARQGGIPWTVEVVGGVIPASGSVELADHRTPLRTTISEKSGGKIPSDLHSRGAWINTLNSVKATWVSIGGIEGQIVSDNSDQSIRKFLFHRKTDGAPVKVKNPVDIKVLGTGSNGEYTLEKINKYIAIFWPFGAHLNAFLPTSTVYGPDKGGPDPSLEAEAEIANVHAMIANISSPQKRYIILYHTKTFPAVSTNQNMQNDRVLNNLSVIAYKKNFPDHYFDFVSAFANGLGAVKPSKDWWRENYPEEFNNPESGWFAELNVSKTKSGEQSVTPKEPAAVASLKIIENGGSGVKTSLSVATVTKSSSEFLKTGLKVGVEALKGKTSILTVREGGIGYAVGDRVTIPTGSNGNASPIIGEVTALREETIGTVRNPDGSVDIKSSYSQWDLDNGYIPRVFRRDAVHFNARGADYLCLLLAARIMEKGW